MASSDIGTHACGAADKVQSRMQVPFCLQIQRTAISQSNARQSRAALKSVASLMTLSAIVPTFISQLLLLIWAESEDRLTR